MKLSLERHGLKTRVLLRAIAMIVAVATPIGPAAHSTWPIAERTCARLWTKADANHDGVVMGAEATPYLAAARRDGRLVPDDGRIGRPTFMEQCRVGVYARAPRTDSDPPKPTEVSRQDLKPTPRPLGLP